MKRPAFQFYPGDWRLNSKLRRCSLQARGAWIEIMCVLHDEDEYGVARYPLRKLASAAGVPFSVAKELADVGVIKGADSDAADFVHTPRHAGKAGDPVILVKTNAGPVWYCSRFVKDEWLRSRRGASTRFDSENQPLRGNEEDTLPLELESPSGSPTRRVGERQGDGASSSSSSTERRAKAKSSLRSDSSPASPGDPHAKREQRLRAITLEAIAAYNAALAVPHGVLPVVRTTVGIDTRIGNVRRCVKVASEICQETYGAPAVTPQFWADYFAAVKLDPFKSGTQEPGKGHENWKPGFEYLTRKAVMLEVFDRAESEAA